MYACDPAPGTLPSAAASNIVSCLAGDRRASHAHETPARAPPGFLLVLTYDDNSAEVNFT